jgi:hypothetical protein
MSPFLTAKENIAINVIFEWMGEDRCNRTHDEYMAIWARLPKVEALFEYVNQSLRKIERAKAAPYKICYFQRGDRYIWYEDFPRSLSRELVRTALIKFFGRPVRRHNRVH